MTRLPRPAKDAALPRVLAPRLYRIDPGHSLISFAVRFLGLFTVRGEVGGVTGTIVLSPEPSERSLRVRASTADIRTGLGMRDRHLRSRNYFDARHHPEITFQAARIDNVGEHVRIVGTLVLRGVAHEIDIAATVARTGPRIVDPARGPGTDVEGAAESVRYESRFTLDRSSFAIARRFPGDLLIGRSVHVHVVLEGKAV